MVQILSEKMRKNGSASAARKMGFGGVGPLKEAKEAWKLETREKEPRKRPSYQEARWRIFSYMKRNLYVVLMYELETTSPTGCFGPIGCKYNQSYAKVCILVPRILACT